MKSFRLMMGFFTRIPSGRVEYEEVIFAKGIKFLPLIGLIIGVILYMISFISILVDLQVTAMVIIGTYCWVTGGIHLDGMADTCDGIFSGREEHMILEIMKDSHIGTFGVISLILYFVFFYTFIPRIPLEALICMPIIGKGSMIVVAFHAKYPREEGMGKLFILNCKITDILIAIVFIVMMCIFVDEKYLVAAGISFFIAEVVKLQIEKKINGLTGDTLGFICEVSQMIFIVCVYMIGVFKI